MKRDESKAADGSVSKRTEPDKQRKKAHWLRLRNFVLFKKGKNILDAGSEMPDTDRGSVSRGSSLEPDSPQSMNILRSSISKFPSSTKNKSPFVYEGREYHSTGQIPKKGMLMRSWRRMKPWNKGETGQTSGEGDKEEAAASFFRKQETGAPADFVSAACKDSTRSTTENALDECDAEDKIPGSSDHPDGGKTKGSALRAIKNAKANETMLFITSDNLPTSPLSIASSTSGDAKDRNAASSSAVRPVRQETGSKEKEVETTKVVEKTRSNASEISGKDGPSSQDRNPQDTKPALVAPVRSVDSEDRISAASDYGEALDVRKVESEIIPPSYGSSSFAMIQKMWRGGRGSMLAEMDSGHSSLLVGSSFVRTGIGRSAPNSLRSIGAQGNRRKRNKQPTRISGTDLDSPWGVREVGATDTDAEDRNGSKNFRMTDIASVLQGLAGRRPSQASSEPHSLSDESSSKGARANESVDMLHDEFVEYTVQNLQKQKGKSKGRRSVSVL